MDFEQLTENLGQLEHRSWAAEESLRSLTKHELTPALRARLTHFLAQCARRVAMLRVVHRRICNRWGHGPERQDFHRHPSSPSRPHHTSLPNLPRFHAFLLYLGYTAQAAREVRVTRFCHTLREFALEYRTCRERVLQQQQKRATYRERNKTRGRMITEVGVPPHPHCLPWSPSLTPAHPSPLSRQRSSQVWLGRPPATQLSRWPWAVGQAQVMLIVMPA